MSFIIAVLLFYVIPLKYRGLHSNWNGPYPVQIVLSVSKKRFKKAVDRNLVKRRITRSLPACINNNIYIAN